MYTCPLASAHCTEEPCSRHPKTVYIYTLTNSYDTRARTWMPQLLRTSKFCSTSFNLALMLALRPSLSLYGFFLKVASINKDLCVSYRTRPPKEIGELLIGPNMDNSVALCGWLSSTEKFCTNHIAHTLFKQGRFWPLTTVFADSAGY